MASWWSGLSETQRKIFVLCGFGTAVVSLLSAMFYVMVQLA